MKIYFDPFMDSGGWPLLPDGAPAVAGEVWAGGNRLLNILETMTGTETRTLPLPVRASGLVPVMDSMLKNGRKPFWTESFGNDPYGVARTLIHMRDELFMAGFRPEHWKDRPGLPRLGEVAELSSRVLPGIPDSILNILHALEDYSGFLPEIRCMVPMDQLAPLWQRLLQKLEDKGARIETCDNAGQADQPPSEIVLFRPRGNEKAADAIAAWLRTRVREGKKTVIISGDKVLDTALRRHGLPASGTGSGISEFAAAQILPLVISLGWDVPDPETVLEFLFCSLNPLPAFVCRMLVSAISTWPAVGSPEWKSKVEHALSKIEKEPERHLHETRINLLFSTENRDNESYSMAELEKRTGFLNKWLTSRAHGDPAANAALSSCTMFAQMVERLSRPSVTGPMLEKLLADAVQHTACPPLHEPQAGITFVNTPAAIHGNSDIIIWWNFTEDSAESPNILPLFQQEREGLAEHGIKLPEAVEIARGQVATWQRATRFAHESLVLVCPRGGTGQENVPHPFWDDIEASGRFQGIIRNKTSLETQVDQAPSAPLALPSAATVLNFNEKAFSDRDCESFSSLASLLSCPFRWLADYRLGLGGGSLSGIMDAERAAGNLAHSILEEVLATRPLPGPEEAGKKAEALFREKAPLMVAMLFQPGMEIERENIISWLGNSAEYLVKVLHSSGASVIETEKEYRQETCGLVLYGRPDLVIQNPDAIIDIKLYRSGARKESMENNTALQLAIYAGLFHSDTGRWPAAGYFSINTQELWMNSAASFKDAIEVPGLEPEKLLKAPKKGHDHIKKELARGIARTDVEERPDGDAANLDEETGIFQAERSCWYCGWDAICGIRFIT